MQKPRKRPPRLGEGRPPVPPEARKPPEPRRQLWVSEAWGDYVEEQAQRRGESMREFAEHVLALYKENPAIL